MLLFIPFPFSGGIGENISAGYDRKVPEHTEFLRKIQPRRYCAIQLHGNIPHPKDSQDFGSAESNPGLSHELIPKYQVRPLVHVGTQVTCCHGVV